MDVRSTRWMIHSCLLIVACFLIAAIGVWLDWWAAEWWRIDAVPWQGIGQDHWFGTNALGQDVLSRSLASIATAFEVGGIVGLLALPVGTIFGGIAGYWMNRWPDKIVMWLAGVVDAVPFLLFAGALAVALHGSQWGLQLAMILTFWTSSARVVRAEVARLQRSEFVFAAHAMGASSLSILHRHILPNTLHLVLVQFTIVFVAAIKTEVVLSFLGFGNLQRISWGSMIAESTREIGLGHLNSFLAATGLLCVLVLALTIVADSAQRHVDVRISQ